jgi:cysteine desulfurase
MHANNETGMIQDVAAIGAICRAHDVLFHVDAAQSVGKVAVDMGVMQVDLLSINAHKSCGPKGVGALCLDGERIKRITPIMHGGGQQRGMRPGTLPVHQIAGMGATFKILTEEMDTEVARIRGLRDRLWHGIKDLPGVTLNGAGEQRLATILNVSVAQAEGESLRFALQDLALSGGSACNSASGEPSYVLRALGLSDVLIESSLRLSLGRFTTLAEIDQAVLSFRRGVEYLQSLAPAEVAV